MSFIERCVRYVSCSSGGTGGFLHVGAVSALRYFLGPQGYDRWRTGLMGVSGCSAGCFVALAILLDVSMEDLEHSLPLRTLMARLTSDLPNAVGRLGASDTDVVVEAVSLILQHGGMSAAITLQQMHRFTRTRCVFVCTSLTHRRRVYLSHESHPHVRVVHAVAASCCIPGVFRPVRIDSEYMVDGFLVESVPMPFPVDETLYIIVEHPPLAVEGGVLTVASYTSSLLQIISRHNEHGVPRHRRIVMRHDAKSPVFDPFLSEKGARQIRHKGFVQAMSALHFGQEDALHELVYRLIDVYVRCSIVIDITTTDAEYGPPFYAT